MEKKKRKKRRKRKKSTQNEFLGCKNIYIYIVTEKCAFMFACVDRGIVLLFLSFAYACIGTLYGPHMLGFA